MKKKIPLYEEIANQLILSIDKGTLKPGEKVPSIRKFSHDMKVSINTIKEAYSLLETRRIIEAKPQSGYYICNKWPELPDDPTIRKQDLKPTQASTDEVFKMVMKDLYDPSYIPLGAIEPNHQLLPTQKLNRILAAETKKFEKESISYIPNPGLQQLRKEIAKRYIPIGLTFNPDDIFITCGCVEATIISLFTVCKHGDTVAIESPFFPCSFLLLEQLGLKIIEIPTHPNTGISIETLEYALENNKIDVCFLIPNYNNPMGSLMPEENKRRVVKLLLDNHVPIIEDDIFGELYHRNERPTILKCYDDSDSVIHCSSFSKTVAPGYRIGWAIPGKYKQKFDSIKRLFHNTPASPVQLTMAEYLASGGYDRFLRKIRQTYAINIAKMAEAVGEHFPRGTRVTRPEGGFFLWLVMPEKVDSVKLYERALEKGISIGPGIIYTRTNKFRNCIRINTAHWSPEIHNAVQQLGLLAHELLNS